MDKKLLLYKFDNKARQWVANYMRNRKMFVEIRTKISESVTVDKGVPQGSILGPLLFSMYTNELPELAKVENCHDPSHRKRTNLFSPNCKLCGTIPCFANDATYHIGTKNRNTSQ